MEQKNKTINTTDIIDEGTIVAAIDNANMQLSSIFQPLYEEANINFELVYGDHWAELSAAQKKEKFTDKNRIDISLPVLYPKVSALLGFQKANRERIETEGVGPEDELTAQIYNAIFRSIERDIEPKKYEYSESDAFHDATVGCYGAVEIYIESNKFKQPQIKFRYIPMDEVMFNLNFDDAEMTNCSRIQHVYKAYIDELKMQYPESNVDYDSMVEDYERADNIFKRPLEDFFYDETGEEEVNKRKVKVIRDWNRKLVNYYLVEDTRGGTRYKFFDLGEAKKYKERLEQHYISQAENEVKQEAEKILLAPDNIDRIREEIIIEIKDAITISDAIPQTVVEYTVVAGTKLLEKPRILDVEDEMPITILFSIFNKKFITSLVSISKKAQQYIDRLFSQLDYNIGTDAKTGAEVNVDVLATDVQEVSDMKKAYVEGGLVFKHGGAQAFQPFTRNSTDPEYFQLIPLVMQMMEDVNGGRNFQGSSERTAQSGKAIGKLQYQAQIMALNIIDNLQRFKHQIGRKTIKYIKKYYDYKMTIKILGSDTTEKIVQLLQENPNYQKSLIEDGLGYLTINNTPEEVDKLVTANLNIDLKLSSLRQDEKEIEYEKLLMLKQQGYDIPPEAFFEVMNLRPTTKQLIAAAWKKQQEQMMQQMAQQQKVAEDMQDANEIKKLSEGAKIVKTLSDAGANSLNNNSEKPIEKSAKDTIADELGI